MYYLQKICILIEKEEQRNAFEGLKEVLAEDGIRMEWESAAFPTDGNSASAGLGNIITTDREATAILWITDNGHRARELLAEKQAVLAYFHEGNREQSFEGVKYAFEEPGGLDAEYLERVYRRYAGIPWDILETRRCRLRETIEEDVPAFYEIYKEPDITRYMEDLFADPEEELAYTRDYREQVYDFYGFGIWTVLKKDTGEIIGRAGCTYREGYEDPELGFVIGVPWQRQGYAKEVCLAVMKYAAEYLGFERMQAFVKEGNEASIRLCEKMGMKETERLLLVDNYMEKAKGCAFDSTVHIRFVRDI